jgi:hypothetical protein
MAAGILNTTDLTVNLFPELAPVEATTVKGTA